MSTLFAGSGIDPSTLGDATDAVIDIGIRMVHDLTKEAVKPLEAQFSHRKPKSVPADVECGLVDDGAFVQLTSQISAEIKRLIDKLPGRIKRISKMCGDGYG